MNGRVCGGEGMLRGGFVKGRVCREKGIWKEGEVNWEVA